MALYGPIRFDSRVRREATSLVEAGYDVQLVCLAGESDEDPERLPAGVNVIVRRPTGGGVLPGAPNPFGDKRPSRLAAIRQRVGWLGSYVRNLRAWGSTVPDAAGPVDAWHLHDFVALAAVLPRLPKGVPVVYDAHDLFLETGTALRLPGFARRLLRRYEGRLVRRVTAVVTVNGAVAKVLERRYHPARITVVRNCPPRTTPPAVRSTILRDVAGIPAESPVILHHGRLDPQRGVEELMLALLERGLDAAHVVLLGFGDNARYRAMSAEARFGGRVHVIDAVPPSQLIDWVASADLQAMPLHGTTMNLYLSTPNKLFESLGAGIPVVASDFPAIREVLLDPAGSLGALCTPGDPASIAAAIRTLLELPPEEREALRARCLHAAQTRWNWEAESANLTALYGELVPLDRPRG
jgi:glycosyltransferase involved in cell wall biosynthesis